MISISIINPNQEEITTKIVNPTQHLNNLHHMHLNLTCHPNHNLSHNRQKTKWVVRPERPPEVLNATPYAKAKVPRIKRKQTEPTTTKKITTRNHLEEIPITTNPITIPQDIEMETDASVKSTTQEKQKKPRIKRTPPKIDYQIGKDVLDQKANISVRDLITVSPAMRRQLVVYGYCMKLSQTLIVCTVRDKISPFFGFFAIPRRELNLGLRFADETFARKLDKIIGVT
ncbi:hypothetical protein G6F60_013181 [Rhizopus arrhizus]|nr:hypothetical protein G6F36_014478 [Rhizopus arrhizus]KAG1389871.1 hypothetical protein G6F60_013181 [Rhizopus arrhizus]